MITAPASVGRSAADSPKPGLGGVRSWRPCAVFEYVGSAYAGPIDDLELLK